MASKAFSLFFSLLLFIISAHGRTLQTGKSVDVSHAFSFATTYKGKTNYSDGLNAWVSQFPELEQANLDPCLPPVWTWIECNSYPNPRVIALDLSKQLTLGELPDFSTMDALQTIDVSNNLITGSIPPFLGTFPDLKELNLAGTYFTGVVPDSLACNKNLNIIYGTYSELLISKKCAALLSPPPADVVVPDNPSPSIDTTPDTTGGFSIPATAGTSRTNKKKKKSSLPAILGTTIPLFSALWIAFGVFMARRHKAKVAAAIAQASNQGPSDTPAEEKPMNDLPNNMSPHN